MMAIEIDFLPVGEGKKNGDAIAIRYGSPGGYKVLVYDGGTQDSGAALVDHIKEYYQTEFVDDVINSHPDLDHASGLSVVLEKLSVGKLWMHRPWNHSKLILDYFKDGRLTNNSLRERLQNKMGAAYALERLAVSKGIPISEPFKGMKIGDFFVLSPEKEWYIHDLIADFEKISGITRYKNDETRFIERIICIFDRGSKERNRVDIRTMGSRIAAGGYRDFCRKRKLSDSLWLHRRASSRRAFDWRCGDLSLTKSRRIYVSQQHECASIDKIHSDTASWGPT